MLFKDIKRLAMSGDDIVFKLDKPEIRIPLTITDKKAIEVIELLINDDELEDAKMADIFEILRAAGVWLEILQIPGYKGKQDEPNDEHPCKICGAPMADIGGGTYACLNDDEHEE